MATPTTQPPPTGEHPPRSPYNKWWIASAVVVGLIACCALYLVVSPPYTPRLATMPKVGQAPPAPSSSCGLPLGDQEPPEVTPTGTSWRLVGTMAAPSNPASVGPAQERDAVVKVLTAGGQFTDVAVHVPSCYAPTPLGALYAVSNFLAMTTTPELQAGAADYLCAPGPGLDAVKANLADQPGHRSSGVQITAFRFIGYTPAASATIDMVITNATGSYVHVPVAAVFTGGDWRVQLPATGSPYDGAQVLPTKAGYVSWSGV